MSRNKYPEETVEKILDISHNLFLSKGYDKTTIQDIVTGLGMSKGAIYHHFKSKEAILDRLSTRIYGDMDWFFEIKNAKNLNALQKLTKLFLHELLNEQKITMDKITAPVIQYNAPVILESLKTTISDIAPCIAEIIEEGNRDGSIQTSQPREAAEVMTLLINLWINPGLFPVEKERFMEKVRFYQSMLNGIGIALIDEVFLDAASTYFDAIDYKNIEKTQEEHDLQVFSRI